MEYEGCLSSILPAFPSSFRLCVARWTATLGSVKLELFRETLEIWQDVLSRCLAILPWYEWCLVYHLNMPADWLPIRDLQTSQVEESFVGLLFRGAFSSGPRLVFSGSFCHGKHFYIPRAAQFSQREMCRYTYYSYHILPDLPDLSWSWQLYNAAIFWRDEHDGTCICKLFQHEELGTRIWSQPEPSHGKKG